MKHTSTLAFLWLLLFPGCSGLRQWSDDPATLQNLQTLAQSAAEKAALDTAGKFQITDQSAVERLVDEAKAASQASVNAAVTRLDAQDKAARAEWREETKAQIAASLKGVGGALSATGNPILMGLGLLMGIGGVLTTPKKKEGQTA